MSALTSSRPQVRSIARRALASFLRRSAAVLAALLVLLAPVHEDLDTVNDAEALTVRAAAAVAGIVAAGEDVGSTRAEATPEGNRSPSDCACGCLCPCGHVPPCLPAVGSAGPRAVAAHAAPSRDLAAAPREGSRSRLLRPPRIEIA